MRNLQLDMRNMCLKYLRFVLPALFIIYMGSIVSFTHVHIINGVTIVHSHPYHGDGTDHEHTGTELQLLHQLSTIQQTGTSLFDYTIVPYYAYEKEISCRTDFNYPVLTPYIDVQLRAPPASC